MNIKTKSIEGIKVFLCEKTECWLSKRNCILRQRKAQIDMHSYKGGYYTGSTFDLILCCQDCEVGKFICEEQGVKIKRIKQRKFECPVCGDKIPFEEKLKNGSRLCRKCYNKESKELQREKRLRLEISKGGLY